MILTVKQIERQNISEKCIYTMHAIINKKEVTSGNRIQMYLLKCLIWVLWQLVRVVA